MKKLEKKSRYNKTLMNSSKKHLISCINKINFLY